MKNQHLNWGHNLSKPTARPVFNVSNPNNVVFQSSQSSGINKETYLQVKDICSRYQHTWKHIYALLSYLKKTTLILACIHNYAIKTAAFSSLFFLSISLAIFLRFLTVQPHSPVLPLDAHVLSGKTYSAIPHLNIRLERDPNRHLINLIAKKMYARHCKMPE